MGDRQQIIEVDAIADAPREMLGNELRLEAVAHRLEAEKMSRIDAAGRPERQADTVHRQLEMFSDLVERLRCRAAVHIVLGVYLEPAGRRTPLQDLRNMGMTK